MDEKELKDIKERVYNAFGLTKEQIEKFENDKQQLDKDWKEFKNNFKHS